MVKGVLIILMAGLLAMQAYALSSGWQDIAISENMAGKTLTEAAGNCQIIEAWGDYSQGKWVDLSHFTISDSMIGKGAWIKLANSCTMAAKGYADKLASNNLKEGWNVISVTSQIAGKAFNEIKGDCSAYTMVIYAPEKCPSETIRCLGSYIEFSGSQKIEQAYLGKMLAINAAFDCTLFKTTQEAKITPTAEGVDLIPLLTVSQGPYRPGGEITVTLKVANTGSQSTKLEDMTGSGISNFIKFTNYETGLEAASILQKDHSLATPLQSGQQAELIREKVRLPESTGKISITAAVDSQNSYKEQDETNNRKIEAIDVTTENPGPANLVPELAKPLPNIDKFPAVIQGVSVKIKNKGTGNAEAKAQFLENLAVIKKGDTALCSSAAVPVRELRTIKPGESAEITLPVRAVNGGACELVADATYWAQITADTLSAIAESDEKDNTEAFQIGGPGQCTTLGSRAAGNYCSLQGSWQAQKKALISCTHNFECESDLCMCVNIAGCPEKKCLSAEKKEKAIAASWT